MPERRPPLPSPPPNLEGREGSLAWREVAPPPAPVQTSATLSARLAAVLHGGFVGTIELEVEAGTVVRWHVQETFKSGRIHERRAQPRDPERHAKELEVLLAPRFTGRIVCHCNDGAVVRYAKHSVLDGAADTTPLID